MTKCKCNVIPRTQSDTQGMSCQASAHVARSWIVLSGWPPSGGLRLVIRERGKMLSFWICMCFIFLAITAISCVGTMWKDPMFTAVFFTNTLPSAPGTEWGARRHNRGFFRLQRDENLSISHQSSGPYTGVQLHLGLILKYFYSFINHSMA